MKLVGYYNYTVVPTYLGLCAAAAGLILCLTGQPGWAVICLITAGSFDMVDGRIASTKKDRTPEERDFGIQIDSLCDVISFGVLPASIGFAYGIRSAFYVAAAILLVLAAVIRLGYYNVDERKRQQDPSSVRRESYLGMPVTMSALFVPLALLAYGRWAGFEILYTALTGAMAVCFVLPVRLPKPHGWALALLALSGLAAAVLSVWLLV